MSGHSKWSTIKHKKAALDKKRGKAWSKLARAVTVAAKAGGNPDDNPRLRMAVEKAKDANMPKDTIEKAIKKGTGELEGGSYEEIIYEGYASGGVAVMCKALTDNRARTAPEIKKMFERAGGSLGSPNCVSFLFKQKGVVTVLAADITEERIMELALDAGAEDIFLSGGFFEVTTRPDAYESVKKALNDAGIPVHSADLSMIADVEVKLDLEGARKVMRLVDALEEHDDVEDVYTNSDIPDEVVAELG